MPRPVLTSAIALTVIHAWVGVCSTVASELAHPPATDSARKLNLPTEPYSYSNAELPKHVRAVADRFDNTPRHNPITDHGATLGRVLFYDKTLSVNGTTSCATCHRQKFAFTDPKRLSVGFDGKEVARNSMSLVNVRYYARGRMFWDERAATLEDQVLMPIKNEVEMGHQFPALVAQLQADPIYRLLFGKAFGDSQVTQDRIAKALAQFTRSIVSFKSKYDVGRADVQSATDAFPNFTKQENFGKQQFFGRGKCASCHLESHVEESNDEHEKQSAFFYMLKPTVNGIDSDEPGRDAGVGAKTEKREDVGRFKVPSLRNIEVTGPYMHDGRFHTLAQVIEHYNWSVRPHPNLDPRLEGFAANGLGLPSREKDALTLFLLTLTDRSLLSDPKFSDPFATEIKTELKGSAE